MRTEIKGQCPITGKGAPLENAHIVDYADSLSHHHHNLIRIASDEHGKADTKIIPKSILVAYKQQLVDKLRRELSHEDDDYLYTLKPPLPHPFFIGRDFELTRLISLMETERMIVVQGVGGIGKTQLLLNALQQVCYHNPVLYINIENVNDTKDLMMMLQNGLSEITGNQSGKSFIDDLGGLTITLIFDSLEKLLIPHRDEMEDLITNLLRRADGIQLIVTSQVDLSLFDHEQHTIQLTGIGDTPILSILRHILPVDLALNSDEVNWVIAFCNGHPLSVKLTASLIKFLGNAAKAIEKIEQQDNLEQPLRRVHNKGTSLDRCLSTVFDCLSQEEKVFLFFVKCNPAGLNLERYQLLRKDQDVNNLVASIKQFFFLETYQTELETARVAIPNPIRPFIAQMAKKFDGDMEAIELEAYGETMMEAMIYDSFYVEGIGDGPAEIGIKKLDEELPNILEAFHAALARIKHLEKVVTERDKQYVSTVTGISSALGKFCFTRGYFEYGIMFARAGIKSNLMLDMIGLVAQQYMYLAQIFERQFDLENFKATVIEMEAIARRTDHVDMHVNTNWAKGRLALEVSDWLNAKKHLAAALELLDKERAKYTGTENGGDLELDNGLTIHGNAALLLSELGKVYEFSGELKKAIVYYKRAAAIQEQYNDETNLLSTYHHLGFCLAHTGDLDEGIKLYFITVEGFYRNRQYEYLGNTLSEIGRLLPSRPDLLTNPLLTEECIDKALENLCEQLTDNYQRLSAALGSKAALDAIPNALQGKLLHLIMLVSVLPCKNILWHYMAGLVSLIKKDDSKPNLLILMFALGHIAGGVDEWRVMDHKDKIIKQLCLYCIMLNGGPDIYGKTKIFQWLAFWMNSVGLRTNITPETMWEEALTITNWKGKSS